jgi:hypothetical protein
VNGPDFDGDDGVLGCSGLEAACYVDIATIVTGADVNGAGGTPLSLSAAQGLEGMASGDGLSQVVIAGNGGTATWEIIQDAPHNTGEVQFLLFVDYVPNSAAGIPGTGPGDVAGSFGPLSTLVSATSADLQPRFVGLSDEEPFMNINSCGTNLLWPYVTNQAGFDTGMVIANTSMDPFVGSTAQEGKCTINYYGNASGGAPPIADTTPLIDAGGYAVWTLSSGGGVKLYGQGISGVINSAPGFEGYVIAQCLFQYAHGYAFISDLGSQKLAQGFIALVMDAPMWGTYGAPTRTGITSEPFNQ